MFVNREDELKTLEEAFKNSEHKGNMVIVYGRRRIGKTELILDFASRHDHIYLLATLQSEEEIVKTFSHKIAEHFNDEATLSNPQKRWDSLFTYLVQKIRENNEPTILIFDEFTYLIQQNKAIPSIIQSYWDQYLSRLPVLLILCGSYVGMMEREVLAYKSPLYGRGDNILLLGGLSLKHLKNFLPSYSFENLIKVYGIVGGTPGYLTRIDDKLKLGQNLEKNLFNKTAFLFNDAQSLLRDELKEPRNYFSILKAISFGKNTQKEISDFTGLERSSVGKYLDVLKGMNLIKRVVPVTERKPEKSKKSQYFIADKYYDFWFSFVYPNIDLVEEKTITKFLKSKEFEERFSTYLGRIFEDICREVLVELNKQERLSFYKIGRYWSKKSEIDLVALGKTATYFAECKWTNKEVRVGELRALENKSMEIKAKNRGFIFFSRRGFDESAREYGIKNRWLLLDLDDIEKIVTTRHP